MYREEITPTTPIESIRFYLTDNAYGYIYRSRIFTVGDLISSMSVSDIINEDMLKPYSKLKLVYFIHTRGLKFKDEEVSVIKDGKKTLVSSDTELELLSFLLSKRVNRIFKREGLIKVSDLISKSKEDLLNIPEFGITSLQETILFVHLLGFELTKKTSIELQTSEKTQEESIYQNVPLDEFKDRLSARAYNILRRQNINTISDLITRSIPEMSEIRNMGDVTLDEIVDFVHSLGLEFVGDKTIQNNEIRVLETKIVEEKRRKTEITSRIALKEKLLKRYNYLIREKQKLMKQEEELDEQIRQALANLKPLGEKEKQKLK